MTLYDLRFLFVDDSQLVRIYNDEADYDVVYEGPFDELPEKYEDVEVETIDGIYKECFDGYLGINISYIDDNEED